MSVCHCLECQKRSGSVVAAQARWPDDRVVIEGEYAEYSRIGASGAQTTFRFCATCASTIAYVSDGLPGLTAIPVGAFADPSFPPPHYSVYESRRHGWIAIVGEGIEHHD